MNRVESAGAVIKKRDKIFDIKLLRPLRILLGIICGTMFVGLFIDMVSPSPLVDIQLGPALLSLRTDRVIAGSALFIVVALLLITWFFGRIYCSTLCPLGVLQDATMWLARRRQFKPQRNQWRLRYLLLLGVVVTGAAGLIIPLGLLEPYSFAGRILNNLLVPISDWFNNFIYQSSEGRWLEPVKSAPFATSALVITLIGFLLLIWSAASRGRLFCNTLCPLGTLLGIIARFSRYRLNIAADSCTSCRACAVVCKAGCIDLDNKFIDSERCVMCFNCINACKFSAIGIQSHKGVAQLENPQKTNGSRRRFLAEAGIVGIGSLAVPPLLRQLASSQNQLPVMPPGASSLNNFTSRCTACHLCVKSCPSKVLKPALLAYGPGGIMMPQVDYNHGMCEYSCTTCSNVCPTGALTPLKLREKQTVRIGMVTYYRERCIIVTNGTYCGACAEHCPTGAIEMVPWKDGLTLPRVNPEVCIGCGGCEYICPVQPKKAVIVSGVKHQDNARRPQTTKLPPSEKAHFPF